MTCPFLEAFVCSLEKHARFLMPFCSHLDNNNRRFMAILQVTGQPVLVRTGGFCCCKVLLPLYPC